MLAWLCLDKNWIHTRVIRHVCTIRSGFVVEKQMIVVAEVMVGHYGVEKEKKVNVLLMTPDKSWTKNKIFAYFISTASIYIHCTNFFHTSYFTVIGSWPKIQQKNELIWWCNTLFLVMSMFLHIFICMCKRRCSFNHIFVTIGSRIIFCTFLCSLIALLVNDLLYRLCILLQSSSGFGISRIYTETEIISNLLSLGINPLLCPANLMLDILVYMLLSLQIKAWQLFVVCFNFEYICRSSNIIC